MLIFSFISSQTSVLYQIELQHQIAYLWELDKGIAVTLNQGFPGSVQWFLLLLPTRRKDYSFLYQRNWHFDLKSSLPAPLLKIIFLHQSNYIIQWYWGFTSGAFIILCSDHYHFFLFFLLLSLRLSFFFIYLLFVLFCLFQFLFLYSLPFCARSTYHWYYSTDFRTYYQLIIHISYRVMKVLMKNQKLCVNTKDEDLCTPLHYAASHGHYQATKLLLEFEVIDSEVE